MKKFIFLVTTLVLVFSLLFSLNLSVYAAGVLKASYNATNVTANSQTGTFTVSSGCVVVRHNYYPRTNATMVIGLLKQNSQGSFDPVDLRYCGWTTLNTWQNAYYEFNNLSSGVYKIGFWYNNFTTVSPGWDIYGSVYDGK